MRSIIFGDIGEEVEYMFVVVLFVVVLGDKFDKVVVQGDISFGVEDGRVGIVVEVRGDNFVFGVVENVFEFIFGSFFEGGFDGFVVGGFFEMVGEVDNGDVGGGDMEGYVGKFVVEFGDNFVDGFGGIGVVGDDVLSSVMVIVLVFG